MIIVYIILFFLVFFLLRTPSGLKYIIGIDLLFQIFGGNINESFTLLLAPIDWATLIVLFNIFLYTIQNYRNYFFKHNWIDHLVFFYFLIVLLIPGLVNYFIFDVPINFKYFIPIRFYLVYRVYFCLFEENKFRYSSKISIKTIFKILLVLGAISAIITISRFFHYPGIKYIENLWPVYYDHKQISMSNFGRLTGTMSGTNGTGNYFCILTVISLAMLTKGKIKTGFYTILFAICVILSGSFSSIAALATVLFIYFRKNILSLKFLSAIILAFCIFFIISNTDVFQKKIKYRFETGYTGKYQKGIIPSNLMARTGYWNAFVSTLIVENRFLFGLGPGGFFNYQLRKNNIVTQNAESYYFRILNESGIIALFFVLYFFLTIYRKISINERKGIFVSNYLLLKLILVVFIVAGIANETLYYGANTSMFGLFLALVYHLTTNMQNYKYVTSKKKLHEAYNNNSCL